MRRSEQLPGAPSLCGSGAPKKNSCARIFFSSLHFPKNGGKVKREYFLPLLLRIAVFQPSRGLFFAELLVSSATFRIFVSQDGGGKQSGIDCPRLANGKRAHRDPAWHLNHG